MPNGQRKGRRSNQPTCMRWYVTHCEVPKTLLGTIKSTTLCVGRDIASYWADKVKELGHWMLAVASH